MNIDFLEIKPNNEKKKIDFILENINKYLVNNINIDKKLLEDIEYEINDIITFHSNCSPIKFINEFYNNNNNDNDNIYYDIICYDFYDDKLNIILSDKMLNSTSNYSKLNDLELNDSFNLLGTLLSKYNNNNTALLGTIFILTIDKNLFEDLYNYTKDNKTYEKVYYSFNIYNLIKSFINVYFIKIYVKPINTIYYYTRDILDNAMKNFKHDIINNKYVKCYHNDLIIYIKFIDPLLSTSYHIMSLANNNKLFFISLKNDDIEYLSNL